MKKILSVILLATIFIFVSGQEKVSAQDVWVGTSPATGWQCYLMTETIRDVSDYNVYVHRFKIQATLKMVTQSQNVKYLYYTFREGVSTHYWYFSNDQGFEGMIDQYKTPIEYNALKVVMHYIS